MPLILGTNSIKETGYNVANSLRFNDGSSDSLTKSFSGSGNRRTWTVSVWFKLSLIPPASRLFSIGNDASSDILSAFFTSGDLRFENDESGSKTFEFRTDQVFRDPSAWSHLVFAVDTTQSTSSNRVKIYHNGSQITSFSTENYPSQNSDTLWNHTTGSATIGARAASSSGTFFDGYMAEIVSIDGQQLDPTSFGEFDSDSPTIWKPKDVSGLTFGTNGFHLDFENASSLGADVSGNGNNFTVNNLTSIDQTTDTCTNNYATLNPLLDVNATPTFTEGNLVFQGTGSTNFAGATIPVSSGKWYVEVKATTVSGSYPIIGVIDSQSYKRRDSTYFVGSDIDTNNPSGFAVFSNGDIYHNNDNNFSNLTTTYTSGDIIGMALNMDASPNTLGFYKNGALEVTINLDTAPSGAYMFASAIHSSTSSAKGEFNFGNPTFSISSGNSDGNGYGNFEYAVPSGYYSLNTKNLAEFG